MDWTNVTWTGTKWRGSCAQGTKPSDSMKMHGISRLAEEALTSQEIPCLMELADTLCADEILHKHAATACIAFT